MLLSHEAHVLCGEHSKLRHTGNEQLGTLATLAETRTARNCNVMNFPTDMHVLRYWLP